MIVLTSVLAALLAAPERSATLNLNFESGGRSGEVMVAIFDDEDAWKRREGAVRTLKVQPGRTVRVEGLRAGRYGIMAFLDRNGDGRLNTLPIGLPTEPYGFSRNARGAFGPPGWRSASFTVGDGLATQSIRLR